MSIDQTLAQNRFIRNFLKDKWLIAVATGVMLLCAIIYVVAFYTPSYQSQAKVWIKDTSSENYVTETDRNPQSELKPLTTAGNPLLTQVEILKSNEMRKHLESFVRQKNLFRPGHHRDDVKLPKDILKVKTEPGTDIITTELKWHDPVLSQQMLASALAKFDEINIAINGKIRTKKRQYIDQRVAEIEAKLVSVRDRIKNYQQGSGAVDLDEQSKKLIELRSILESRLADVTAAQRNAGSNASALQGQLGMSSQAALNAVALGSGNENLVKMRTTLNELRQQYAHNGIKEAPTNPKMVALKSQIDTLEKQINDEVVQTVGQNGSKQGVHIYDTVRGQLAQDLASSRARMQGLSSEAASLRASLAQVSASLQAIPGRRFSLSNLKQEEDSLAQALDELKRKQIEARIKEAETPSNIFVVDPPALPEEASFPTAKHILALSILLGLMVGMGISGTKTYFEDVCEGPEAIAEITQSKVLGIIPWLRRPVTFHTSEQKVLSINDLAYKNILSSLRMESDRRGARILAFTSSSLRKSRVSTLYTLAYRLSRYGHSVVMIDADFRSASLHNQHLGEDERPAINLSDLILDVDRKIRQGQEVYPHEILAALIPDRHGVYLALNAHDVDHAYDYFASKGFRYILNVLREHFEWVFIDTPSALIAPEFLAIAQASDGVVLFANRKATQTTLNRISRKIRETDAPFIGTIVRDQNPIFEKEHHHYTGGGDYWSGGGRMPEAAIIPAQSKRVDFMGAKIDALSMEETLERIGQIIRKRNRCVQHVVVNVAKLVSMQRDPELRRIVNNCELINADGAGVVIGARMMNLPVPERVAGIDLMERLVGYANEHGYRLYFFGAEEHIVQSVVQKYRQEYPNLVICGSRNGYYAPEEEADIAESIRDARPDILFVAMGSPHKERFINRYLNTMNVPFVMGVGGSFDVVAGKVKRAPEWMQHAGMEWCYRLAQEPRRMWKRYLVTNFQYGCMLLGRVVFQKVRPESYG